MRAFLELAIYKLYRSNRKPLFYAFTNIVSAFQEIEEGLERLNMNNCSCSTRVIIIYIGSFYECVAPNDPLTNYIEYKLVK